MESGGRSKGGISHQDFDSGLAARSSIYQDEHLGEREGKEGEGTRQIATNNDASRAIRDESTPSVQRKTEILG